MSTPQEPQDSPLRAVPAELVALLLSPAARALEPAALMERVVAVLRGPGGVPIDRSSWSIPTLHPEVRAHQLIWTEATGVVEHARRWAVSLALIERSPLRPLFEGAALELHLPIAGTTSPRAYDLLDQLADQGFTDYLVGVLPGAPPLERGPVSWATRAPGGFTPAQLETLRGALPLLSLVLLVHAQRARARALLHTYLGADAAERVLAGSVRRGELLEREAAILFCDLRGYTALSARLEPSALLSLLNDVFDVVVGAIEAEGGEVLKFIGDAVLAVFAADGGGAGRAAAGRALAAARAGLAGVGALAAAREAAGAPPVAVGFGLHLGRVLYGNIGGHNRLDFTVVGPDVNLASRVEGLCGGLGVAAAATGALVAALAPEEAAGLQLRGPMALKGVPGTVDVWVLPRG